MRILVLLLSTILIAIPAVAQSTRTNSSSAKKANQRPESLKKTALVEKLEDDIDNSVEFDDELINIETAMVTLPVRVIDRQGRFVGGLQKKDFSVFEEDNPQVIEYFSTEASPFTVALILDMSPSSSFKIDQIQQAALTFVTKLRSEDRVMVIAFDSDIHILCEPTSDRKTIDQAIVGARLGMGTSVYDTVDFVLNRRLNAIKGRKAVVLFSDGVDTTSESSDSSRNLRDALEYDALIYSIHYDTFADVKAIESGARTMPDQPTASTTPPIAGGRIPTGTPSDSQLPFPIPSISIGGNGRSSPMSIPGSGTSKEDYRQASMYLNELTKRTGGRMYEANSLSTLSRAFSQIASELREFYSLGYYPPNAEDERRRRKIRVKVAREKVAIESRDSYVIGKSNKN